MDTPMTESPMCLDRVRGRHPTTVDLSPDRGTKNDRQNREVSLVDPEVTE